MTEDNIIPEDKLLEGYWHLMFNKYGYLEDLNKIHPSLAQYLIKEGVIGQGINTKAQLRYHVTKHGEKIARAQCSALTLKSLNTNNNLGNNE